MRATIPIGIAPGTKLLRIERVPRYVEPIVIEGAPWTYSHPGMWLVWIHHNPDFTLGTYLTLYQDGKITNTTVHEDGSEDIFQVKGHDE